MYRAIARYEADFERAHGVGLNEAILLCTLQSGTLSSGEIARRMGLSCSNASKILRAAEGHALVRRQLDDQDRRRMYFSLTPAGRALLKKVLGKPLPLPPSLQGLQK